eukprot:TRINITY_DN41926_c0_g1_i1.p1 TRINITY_DN41926_c0_g1~~TRINITY_DN41926_c0_g1_i1.p1  ORF type:complete len:225 (+),score=12.14 TRINITY_DN41926_c0_g1_i1:102-677(+)
MVPVRELLVTRKFAWETFQKDFPDKVKKTKFYELIPKEVQDMKRHKTAASSSPGSVSQTPQNVVEEVVASTGLPAVPEGAIHVHTVPGSGPEVASWSSASMPSAGVPSHHVHLHEGQVLQHHPGHAGHPGHPLPHPHGVVHGGHPGHAVPVHPGHPHGVIPTIHAATLPTHVSHHVHGGMPVPVSEDDKPQ